MAKIGHANSVLVPQNVRNSTGADNYDELFALIDDRILRLCLRSTHGNHALAEDLAQEARIRCFEYLHQFSGDRAAFTTWAHTITIRVCHNHFRKPKEKFHINLVAVDGLDKSCALIHDSGFLGSARNVDWRLIEKAVNLLPERIRKTFVASHIEGMKLREIAKRNSCSVGSVKSEIHRARVKLKEILNQLLDSSL